MKQTKSLKATPKMTTTKKKPVKKLTNNKQTAKNGNYQKYIGWSIATLIGATYVVSLFAGLNTKLLPAKYVLPLVTVSLLIVALVAFINIRYRWRSLGKSITLITISLVVLLANGYVYSISKSTSDFLASIESGEYTLESYSIVTKKDYDTTLKSSIATGYLADDTNNAEVLEVLADKTNAQQKPNPELASLTIALDDKTTDTVVFRSSLLPLLEENYPSFYQNIKVLDTFSIRVKARSAVKVDITKPFVIYISGIDTYGEISTVSRSDVNILAVVDPRTNKILLVNTPRDYYVQLHGTTGTRDKLTHAGIYGVDMSKDTMQDLYGIDISYYVRINFTSLLNIIDAIGGVNVYSDNDFTVWKYHFVQGYNQLNADQALVFSRERHSFTDGDRTRGKNQERVIQAIIDKMSQPATLARFPKIIKSLEGSFQTNASHDVITALLKQQMNSLGAWTTESISVDGVGSQDATYSMGSQLLYVMEPNIASVNLAKDKIQSYLK